MRKLDGISIASINCVLANESLLAIKHCSKSFEFDRSILFTDQNVLDSDIEVLNIGKLNWNQYNDFVLRMSKYIDSDYLLLVQDDGYIINPDLWTNEFLEYDYIGAPWPNENSWIELQHKDQISHMRRIFPKNRVGNGGFSLRSKKFLEFSAQFQSCNGIGEDSFLCTTMYDQAIEYGIKFAPLELAVIFSYENPCVEFDCEWNTKMVLDTNKHFGWHGRNFLNTTDLLSLKYKL